MESLENRSNENSKSGTLRKIIGASLEMLTLAFMAGTGIALITYGAVKKDYRVVGVGVPLAATGIGYIAMYVDSFKRMPNENYNNTTKSL